MVAGVEGGMRGDEGVRGGVVARVVVEERSTRGEERGGEQ